jgi:hypothetical protein
MRCESSLSEAIAVSIPPHPEEALLSSLEAPLQLSGATAWNSPRSETEQSSSVPFSGDMAGKRVSQGRQAGVLASKVGSPDACASVGLTTGKVLTGPGVC